MLNIKIIRLNVRFIVNALKSHVASCSSCFTAKMHLCFYCRITNIFTTVLYFTCILICSSTTHDYSLCCTIFYGETLTHSFQKSDLLNLYQRCIVSFRIIDVSAISCIQISLRASKAELKPAMS